MSQSLRTLVLAGLFAPLPAALAEEARSNPPVAEAAEPTTSFQLLIPKEPTRRTHVLVPLLRACPYDLVGGLSQYGGYRELLSLADTQRAAIDSLDTTLRGAHLRNAQTEATLPGDSAVLEAYFRACSERHRNAVFHAERMVATGLLTPEQYDRVVGRVLGGWDSRHALQRQSLQTALGFSSEQAAALNALNADRASYAPEWYKQHVPEGESVETLPDRERSRIAVQTLLTPTQLAEWDRLVEAAKSPAPSPTDPTAEAQAEAQQRVVQSAVFRAAASADAPVDKGQIASIAILRDIAVHGLARIADGPSDSIDRRSAEFLGHAEQALLLGMLRADQAANLQEKIDAADRLPLFACPDSGAPGGLACVTTKNAD